MRATELIERFNEVIQLTQKAWRYEGQLNGEGNMTLAKDERLKKLHEAAETAAEEFCQLLSDNESA
jgi:uncharacterized protein YihD (DUF1040 family)